MSLALPLCHQALPRKGFLSYLIFRSFCHQYFSRRASVQPQRILLQVFLMKGRTQGNWQLPLPDKFLQVVIPAFCAQQKGSIYYN